ncbi:hypothetical protein [Methylothermus subterraneus]
MHRGLRLDSTDGRVTQEVYWQLHCQPPDAWTHELDLRPFVENF